MPPLPKRRRSSKKRKSSKVKRSPKRSPKRVLVRYRGSGAGPSDSSDTFYVMTTAITHTGMQNKWSDLLANILGNLPLRFTKLSIIHFYLTDRDHWGDYEGTGYTGTMEQDKSDQNEWYFTSIHAQSASTAKRFGRIITSSRYRYMFPHTEDEFKEFLPLGIEDTPNVLIDMAHLVQLSDQGIHYRNVEPYDTALMSRINYIYLGYNTFIEGLLPNAPPLMEVDDQNRVWKFCYQSKSLREAPSTSSAQTGPNMCIGGCGWDMRRPGALCSKCPTLPVRIRANEHCTFELNV
jgi:hypothetical protein